MRHVHLLRLAAVGALGLALAAPAPAQLYETLAFESFDYTAGENLGGQNGGSRWLDQWFSGSFGDAAIIGTPSFDAIGEKATTTIDNEGSYRTIATACNDAILDNGLYGLDNTTLWISFMSKRAPGSDDDYGGLSLFIRFGGEQFFMGSPSFHTEWGFHDLRGHPAPEIVAGSNDGLLTHLVYRIDFLPGQERIRLWLDPAVPHPSTAADLDSMIDDLRFDEIRIQSGNSILSTGFDFDAILIETPAFRPLYTAGSLVAGQQADLKIENLTPGNQVVIAYSLQGAGPVNSQFGPICLSPPIVQLPAQTAGPNGEISLMPTVPPGLSGSTVYSQAVELTGGGSGVPSNPVAVQVL